MKILIINGPNLNMLGLREKEIYGTKTYQDLVETVTSYCRKSRIDVDFFQSNHEGDIVDRIQDAHGVYDGIVINPAAYTHTSIAILDALKAVSIPTVEVHISDPFKREEFRRHSFVSPACIDTFAGHGFDGYLMAVKRLVENT